MALVQFARRPFQYGHNKAKLQDSRCSYECRITLNILTVNLGSNSKCLRKEPTTPNSLNQQSSKVFVVGNRDGYEVLHFQFIVHFSPWVQLLTCRFSFVHILSRMSELQDKTTVSQRYVLLAHPDFYLSY